ncbi:hypothetical protein [Flavonifractor sp. An306]|uniref:hypothetical protein n=1 Tax=Flavonifractor sp. An306 TaxID=1965629 RepID=UPI0017491AB5|nr:hypothetical protein [Flavonifractor sp. An306]
MKVKVMSFPICRCGTERKNQENAEPQDIEQIVNGFCETVNVLSITCTPVTVRAHNNGGFDQVELWYNIAYEDKKSQSLADAFK